MGPKGKKAPKNAFSFFLDEYVERLKESGRTVSFKIAAEECSPMWKALSEEEREKYNKLAQAHKAYRKETKVPVYTNTGISVAELEREQEELRRKTERADNEIKLTISHLDSETLKTHLFYIIHCNYYCKTSEGIYVPGELAIAEFSLGDGVRRTYHTLINPGSIPLGYAFEAKQTIEEVHGLPYPPYEEGESNYYGLLNEILNFIEAGKLPDERYPPLYCIENNIKASESILQALSENIDDGDNFFRVFLLHKMFFWLKNKCVEFCDEENIGFPVMSNAESEINKDVFRYSPGISCSVGIESEGGAPGGRIIKTISSLLVDEDLQPLVRFSQFHVASEDKFQNCSLSVVQRLVFLVCDHCCQYVDVKIIPGKHCRLNCDTDRKATRARFPAPAPSEAEYEGQSSYADDFSALDWEKDEGASFLQDEIESKISGFDASSVASKSSRHVSTPTCTATSSKSRRLQEEDEDESDTEDEDLKKFMSLGRGSMRF